MQGGDIRPEDEFESDQNSNLLFVADNFDFRGVGSW